MTTCAARLSLHFAAFFVASIPWLAEGSQETDRSHITASIRQHSWEIVPSAQIVEHSEDVAQASPALIDSTPTYANLGKGRCVGDGAGCDSGCGPTWPPVYVSYNRAGTENMTEDQCKEHCNSLGDTWLAYNFHIPDRETRSYYRTCTLSVCVYMPFKPCKKIRQ